MLRKLCSRITYGNVMATVALGGTTYAATTIGSGDIKTDALLGRHIKNSDVRNLDRGTNEGAER